MKKEELNKMKMIVCQIRKYKLENVFDSRKSLDKWILELTTKQIDNFISLKIDPSEIEFPASTLIDKNLLNCDDYSNRIAAMTKLKNAKGWYHLFGNLCSPNFLNSKNYYEDMEMISKAPSAQYPLWIVNSDTFINSPYHKEDLKLIVEAKDQPHIDGYDLDWLVAEALTIVASNADSIKSPYHQKDMQIIAQAGSECLQSSSSNPKDSLNCLAINTVSLKDKYHLDNMQLLANHPEIHEFLYELATNPKIIKGKYYRNEVHALASAKSVIKAIAIFFYITNPDVVLSRFVQEYHVILDELGLDFTDAYEIKSRYRSEGSNNINPNYLRNLELLNQVDDRFVLYIESLLSNAFFTNSPNRDHDLKVLLSIQDKDLFIDLYKYLYYTSPLENKHHIKDLDIISKTEDKELRGLMVTAATKEESINSPYHDYDMEYLSKLDLSNINGKVLNLMSYYLLNITGINHPKHIERLEKLAKGETIFEDTKDAILKHLDYLENNPESIFTDEEEVEVEEEKEKPKTLSKFRQFFRRK